MRKEPGTRNNLPIKETKREDFQLMQAQGATTTQPEVEKKHVVVTPHKKSLWQEIYRNRWSYLYIAPMIILLLAFIVYPIFASLGYTLYQWNGIGDPTAFVGFDN